MPYGTSKLVDYSDLTRTSLRVLARLTMSYVEEGTMNLYWSLGGAI